MPYEWVIMPKAPERSGAFCHADGDAPAYRLHLWPYRSLPRRGFAGFIGATCLLLALPLVGVLGSPVLWGLLPFLALAVTGIWLALNRSYADGEILEELTLWSDRVTLDRHGPRGRRQNWQANPHWVRVTLHGKGGPVPNYLTLGGGPREVEIGAFLSEEERLALLPELRQALARGR
ncbi:DUF2244 domain-containing protein [Cereibacter azotoformans]|nr:DUF2244 domain-containing protein [Cereibacter azotoformans]ULB08971.1 DUF2244 domain-containing protein [Cereibacter azotoformans]